MFTPRELNTLLIEVIMAGSLPIKDTCAGGDKIIMAQEVFADGHIIETGHIDGARIYQPTSYGIEFLIRGGYEQLALVQQFAAKISGKTSRKFQWSHWAFGLAGGIVGVLITHLIGRVFSA